MVHVPASSTTELLTMARVGVDAPAFGARLRAVGCGHFDQLSARPRQLVAEHVREAGPACTSDAPGETVVPDHALNVQLLNHDGAVALGVTVAESVQNVIALSPHLAVNAVHSVGSFRPVLGSFLPSRDSALRSRKASQRALKMLRVGNKPTIGIGQKVCHAAIDSNDRFDTRSGFRCLNLAQDAGKPLVSVAADRTGLRCPLKRSVHHGAKVPELREANRRTVQSPHLRVGLAQIQEVAPLALPTREPRQPLEASLECLVQFDEQLSADVAGNISKPRGKSSQFGQFVDLIEGSRVALVGAPKAHQTLLKGEIPQKTQGPFPFRHPSDLWCTWVDAEAKGLANDHDHHYMLVYGNVKRLSYGSARCLQPQRPLGLRAEVSQARHLCPRLCCAEAGVGDSVPGLRLRASRGWLRGRPRASAGCLPPEGRVSNAGQFAQGCERSAAAGGAPARGREQTLGRSLLVPFVLCGLVRRSPARNRQALCRIATWREGFLPALNGGVSAPEIR